MSFESLTNELLIEIVKFACLDGSISTLRSLAGVNQNLNCIAIPMLYDRFNEVSRTSASKLLRAVLANPELATYVRSYTGCGISNGLLSQGGEVLDVSEWDGDDFAACREALDEIEVEIEIDPERVAKWMSRIREGKWHSLTGLLLLLLPNLEDIEMIDYRSDEDGDMEFALDISSVLQESETTDQFVLQHLTDVSLSQFAPQDDDNSYSFRPQPVSQYFEFEDVIPFLRLPSVKSVAISGLSDGMSEYAVPPSPEDTSFTTKDLEINNTCLEMSYLVRLLRLFPSLRRFSYNHVAKEHEPDFLPQEIGKALAHLRPCLEELDISSLCEQNSAYTTQREIGSLAGFESLKIIDLEGDVLLGYPDSEDDSRPVLNLCDILPRSVESLTIGPWDFPSREKHLRELLRVKEERFPALKKIKIGKWLGGSLQDRKGLRREFKAKGVKLLC